MKKLTLIFALLLSMLASTNAQMTDEQLAEEMEKMEQQMQEFMDQLGWGTKGGSIHIDTLSFNGDELMNLHQQFFNNGGESLLSDEMVKLMEQQMQHFFEGNHMELDSLFKSFSFPQLPIPESNTSPKDQTPKKKGKKRKVYTL